MIPLPLDLLDEVPQLRAVDVPFDLGFEEVHIHLISDLDEPTYLPLVAVDGRDEAILVVDVDRIELVIIYNYFVEVNIFEEYLIF